MNVDHIGGDKVFTYVVDPNSGIMEEVPLENLSIYFSLSATVKNRSVVTSDNTADTIDDNKSFVEFITYTEQNGDKYLTTNYLNIGGNETNIEGFGIQSVTINYGAEFTPDVEIVFYDTRGSSLYNTYETEQGGVLFNNSPFSLFFRQPYPIFNMLVKGFYGKAVSYCLHLTKWKAEFDGDNASFVIRANFKAFTSAFLSNIYMNYVIAVGNTLEGKNKLEEMNSISITEMLNLLSSLNLLTENFKDDNSKYDELLLINSLLVQLRSIQKAIGYGQTDSALIFTQNVNTPILSNKDINFIRDVAVLNATKYEDHIQFINQVNDLVASYNKKISENLDKYKSLSSFKINSFYLQTPNKASQLTTNLTLLKTIIEENGDYFDFDTNVTEALIRSKFRINTNQDFDYILINYFFERKKIDELIVKLNEEKKKIEEEVNNNLNQALLTNLGVNLTVREVMSIIMNNVDAFLSVVYDYAFKADSYEKERSIFFTPIDGDIPKFDEKIYPFPAVIDDNGEKAWLGDIVGEDNEVFPEIKLVNNIVNALIFSTSELDAINFKSNIVSELNKTTGEKHIPSNPVDTDINYYDFLNLLSFTGAKLPDKFIKALLDKLVSFAYSQYPNVKGSFNDTLFNLYAKLDASFAFDNTLDQKIKEVIAFYPSDLFLTEILNYYNSNNSGEGYSQNSSLVNNLNSYDAILLPTSDLYSTVYNEEYLKLYPDVLNIINNNNKTYSEYFNIQTPYPSFYNTSKFILEKDLTAIVWDKETQTNINNQKNINFKSNPLNTPALLFPIGLEFIDGFKSETINGINEKYLNVEYNKIGRDLLFPLFNNNTLTDTPYYLPLTNVYAKGLLFLKTLNFKNHMQLIEASKHSCIINAPYSYLVWVGGLIYRYNYKKNTGNDIFLNIDYKNFKNTSIKNEIDFFNNVIDFSDYSEDFLASLQTLFINWVENEYLVDESTGIEGALNTYRKLGVSQTLTTKSTQFTQYTEAYDLLQSFLTKIYPIIVVNPAKIYKESPFTPLFNTLIQNYIIKWIETYKNLYQTPATNSSNNDSGVTESKLVQDKDLKIIVYDNLKTLYDHWLAQGHKDGKAYLACNLGGEFVDVDGKRDKRLIDHFHFIDRTWSDIGDKAVLNPNKILLLAKEQTFTLYQFIGRLLEDNHFLFFTMPTYVNYYNLEDVEKMFTPTPYVEDVSVGPTFVFMYIGGSSKLLDIVDNQYYNDGFDLKEISKANIPSGFIERRTPLNTADTEELSKYNMAAFRVAFADQNQNIFKKIIVGQNEHKNTLEYLSTISDIFDKRGGSKRFYRGVDLYDQFAARSYDCTVTALGNMQIQPLQYFQLDNVPFFHGAYLIMSVNHNITANQVETTFKGYRMPRYVYPIIDTVTSYVNIPLNEVLKEDGTYTPGYLDGTLSNGFDTTVFSQAVLDSVQDSTRTLFSITKNSVQYEFKLPNNLTLTSLTNNINTLFKLNPPINSFGLGKDLCYAWVKNALTTIGVVQTPSSGLHAWDFYVGLGDTRMKYFDLTKTNNFTNADFKAAGVKNGSIIFGFYAGSTYKPDAYNTIKNYSGADLKRFYLTQYRRQNLSKTYNFNPITHVGLYFNDTFYHLVRGTVLTDSTPTFYPIAHYNFLPDLQNLVQK